MLGNTKHTTTSVGDILCGVVEFPHMHTTSFSLFMKFWGPPKGE